MLRTPQESKESKENLKKRREDPSSMMTVPGYVKDKDVNGWFLEIDNRVFASGDVKWVQVW